LAVPSPPTSSRSLPLRTHTRTTAFPAPTNSALWERLAPHSSDRRVQTSPPHSLPAVLARVHPSRKHRNCSGDPPEPPSW
jgi:hypothetical protein